MFEAVPAWTSNPWYRNWTLCEFDSHQPRFSIDDDRKKMTNEDRDDLKHMGSIVAIGIVFLCFLLYLLYSAPMTDTSAYTLKEGWREIEGPYEWTLCLEHIESGQIICL